MFVRRQILMGVNEGPQTIEHLKAITACCIWRSDMIKASRRIFFGD